MKYQELTDQVINEMCDAVEFYDKHRYSPFDNWFIKFIKRLRGAK